MKRNNLLKKITALICATAVIVTGMPAMEHTVKAAGGDFYDPNNSVMLDKGGYKTEVFGVGTDDWGLTYKDRTEKLPPAKTYVTDDYRETVGTIPTNDWASSVVFDQYSESLYAHPLAYRAASNGMQMAAPAVVDSNCYVDGEPSVESLLDDTTVELVVGADGFTAKDASVDKTTDWAYDIVMENNAGTASMRAIIAKGTPYAYYTFESLSPTISLGAGATDLAIFKNTTASNILGVSLKNKKDGKTHYYSLNAPKGTTWTNAGGKLTANMPANAKYLSIAILPDSSDEAFALYEQYAFNFITDTKVEWEYLKNSSKVVTKYNVTTKNMETGELGGDTIIALYPHQWRYADETYTGYTYDTIRGTMKTIIGTSYVTQMTYTGILSTLPVTTDAENVGYIKEQLGYLYYYRMNKEDPKWICFLEGQYGGYDTYWVGKNLNTLADAIWLSAQFKDDADMQVITKDMVAGVENYLQFWFDPYMGYLSGRFVDDYFYYHKDYGTLIGYPVGYDSDIQINDHHFHYGYWIKAAAAVAMQDPQWAKEWGAMVYEMIGDIANANRDGSSYNEQSTTRYPFLRNFDIYEGHSWASGVANYEYDENGQLVDKKGGLAGGNNQESSSEAMNAWASLILWGEAMNDTQVRDLGIYMYTTEAAAIEDYYYDVHNEIFTDKYEDKDNYNQQTVTRLFGGRYDHTAWWTENSIEVTTITMLPITGASLYMGKYPDKVKAVVDSIGENSPQWKHFVANKNQICANYGKNDMLTDPETNQDIIAEYYAFYDADKALEMFDMSDNGKVENGESRAHTLGYITSLKEYGTQNFDIMGSSPFSVVLEKNGVKTYVAENFTNEEQRVYFTDGTYIDVPANSSYRGPKAGDGENPDTDASELLGEVQKFNLETYLENYDGTGYEMTSRQVNVKSESDLYTYEPRAIGGFTFEADNPNNVLTVNVAEGNLETAKVYYKRNDYTVKYVLNGGTNNADNPTSYRYGDTIELKDAKKEGYIFNGWFADAECTVPITAINEATYGNLTLYADFIDADILSNYTVEYYTQKEDKSGYDLMAEDTQNISSIIGTFVNAEVKTYQGYELNPNSITSGNVLPNGKLVLRLYYDLEKKNAGTSMDGRGVSVDPENNMTLFVSDAQDKERVLVYYKICQDQNDAQSAYNNAIATNGAGVPGYYMQKDGDVFKLSGGKVQDTQYVLYKFNIQDQEFTDWKIVSIAELKKQDAEKTEAPYSIHYYKQNIGLNGYDEVTADARTLSGKFDETVVAEIKDYTGFSVNSEKSTLTGVINKDGSLVLNVYYDRNVYTITYKNVDGVINSNPKQYVYGEKFEFADVAKDKYIFKGWYKDSGYADKITGITAEDTENLTLYANFESTEKPTDETTTPDDENPTKPGIDETTTPGIDETTKQETEETTGKNTEVTTKKPVIKVKKPARVKKLKVKRKSRAKASLKWKRVKNANGYQIAIKKGKKGKFKVVKTIKKGKKVRYIKSKLKVGKVYYIKVRAYKKVNGKRVYGRYSKVKKYRIKRAKAKK